MMAIALLNLAWWSRADRWLTAAGAPASRRWLLRAGLACYMILMLLPILWIVLSEAEWRQLPMDAAMWLQLWHMAMVLLVPISAALALSGWLLGRLRGICLGPPCRPDGVTRADDTRKNADGNAVDERCLRSRRAFLRGTLIAAPVALAGSGTWIGRRQMNVVDVRRHVVSPPGLPDRLQGLTITHLSDFHVGRLFRVDHLRRVVDRANALDSDIVVITGDAVDFTNDVLPGTVDALLGLRHRHGLFLCIGNHDMLDDGAAYASYVRGRGLALLLNERRDVEIGGERLRLGGLMWSRRDRGTDRSPGHDAHVAATFDAAAAPHGDPFTLALAHHPHAFDAAAARGIPLTLSGHTHGGQLMLTPPGGPDYGAGCMLFRYVRGFYAGDGSLGGGRPYKPAEAGRTGLPLLFVNAGAGNWFPVRINAPAEIVQLRLDVA